MRYLSAREHSRPELARKLSRYAQPDDDVEALLNVLEAANFLSQSRFTESLINRRAARFGDHRILAELQGHAIDQGTMDDVKARLAQDETVRAKEVWRKKFGTSAPADAAERAKQMRFLQQRGFSHRAIRAAMHFSKEIDE